MSEMPGHVMTMPAFNELHAPWYCARCRAHCKPPGNPCRCCQARQALAEISAPPRLPPLDRECPCDVPAICEDCKGNGYLVTDAGRELIAFLQRHPPNLTHVTFHSTHDHDEYGRVTRP